MAKRRAHFAGHRGYAGLRTALHAFRLVCGVAALLVQVQVPARAGGRRLNPAVRLPGAKDPQRVQVRAAEQHGSAENPAQDRQAQSGLSGDLLEQTTLFHRDLGEDEAYGRQGQVTLK